MPTNSLFRRSYSCRSSFAFLDETGYLNVNRGDYSESESIYAFFAEDSVLQVGDMPSALERLT